jgi:molybdenum cofactor cytidylyltransferase
MIEPREVVAIYLAAGGSHRFGSADKLSAIYRGKPLAMHGAELITTIPFRRCVAVCRVEGELRQQLGALGFTIVTNPSPELGMGRSLALGVAEASRLGAAAAAVFLADMPGVTSNHVMALLGAYDEERDVVGSSDGIARMPPALFGRRHFDKLQGLVGDKGARRMIWNAVTIEARPAMLRDVDTADDLPG